METALVAFADLGQASRAMVHGPGTLELQCALLRRGYTSVFAIRQGSWPLTDTIDVVLLPNVARPDDLDREIAHAHRVLAPLGTLVLHLVAQGTDTLVRHAGRLLALHGFEAIVFQAIAGGTLCRAKLPSHNGMARA